MRKGGVVKRRKYEREGKKVLKAGGIESSSNGGVGFNKKGDSRKLKLKVSQSLSPQS